MKTQRLPVGNYGYIYFQFLSDNELEEQESNAIAKLTVVVMAWIMFAGLILEVVK